METIYEEEDITDDAAVAANDLDGFGDHSLCNQVNFIGLRKLKRSLSCSDGSAATKTTVLKRKRQIKKFMGNYKKAKKLSMAEFLNKLHAMNQNSSSYNGEETGVNSDATGTAHEMISVADEVSVSDEDKIRYYDEVEKERAKSDTEC